MYAKSLGENISPEEAMNIAEYYQNQQDWGKAGEFYALCAQYHKALKLFLQCGESEMDKVSHSSFTRLLLHIDIALHLIIPSALLPSHSRHRLSTGH